MLLKTQSGSRRWQHLAGSAAAAQDGGGAPAGNGAGAAAAPAAAGGGRAGASSPVEQNYTVILGSHRNSCMKFEKDGELCCMVRSVRQLAGAVQCSAACGGGRLLHSRLRAPVHPTKP